MERRAVLVGRGDHLLEHRARVLGGLRLLAEPEPHGALQPHAADLAGGPGEGRVPVRAARLGAPAPAVPGAAFPGGEAGRPVSRPVVRAVT
ncbi:hypothetical protein GCM10010187_63450 [Actinomadura coerulea]|nr:hypothetical protein GCM10010187_63450 [Actinomadura coerulea]